MNYKQMLEMKDSKDIPKKILMRAFILNYLTENCETNSCDQIFHEQFFKEFGGSRKETLWGAEPVRKAQKMLKELYDEGTLDRGIITLGQNWQPGFPKWVYSYTIKK